MYHFLFSGFFSRASAQPVSYQWNIKNASNVFSKQSTCPIKIGIYTDQKCENPVFIEKQQLVYKGDSLIDILIGKGIRIFGNIDSVIWSEGYYYLSIFSDSDFNQKEILSHKALMRIPTNVSPENLEGIAEEKSIGESGEIMIPFSINRRPKKISVDLTSSYVNLAYPADKYPIYRHYEWFDDDANGLGNSFTLSYSENAKHAFFENTHILGELKLYEKPFQQLEINTSNNAISMLISKPISLSNHNQTFAIKGPWKLIYLIEW